MAGSSGRNEGMEWVGQGWELTIDEIRFHWPGHPHASDAWVPHLGMSVDGCSTVSVSQFLV